MENNTQRVWYIYRICQRWKKIVVDVLSRFPLNGNQETTQNSTYQKEIVSEVNDTKEIPDGNFPINLKFIQ